MTLEMQEIYQCALGIMPIHKDDKHLQEIIIKLNDARWTRLFTIYKTAKYALEGN